MGEPRSVRLQLTRRVGVRYWHEDPKTGAWVECGPVESTFQRGTIFLDYSEERPEQANRAAAMAVIPSLFERMKKRVDLKKRGQKDLFALFSSKEVSQ